MGRRERDCFRLSIFVAFLFFSKVQLRHLIWLHLQGKRMGEARPNERNEKSNEVSQSAPKFIIHLVSSFNNKTLSRTSTHHLHSLSSPTPTTKSPPPNPPPPPISQKIKKSNNPPPHRPSIHSHRPVLYPPGRRLTTNELGFRAQ